MKNALSFLQGHKTIVIACGGVLYAAGIHFGWWGHYAEIDLVFGSGVAITLRLAIKNLCTAVNETLDVVHNVAPELAPPGKSGAVAAVLAALLLPAFLFTGCSTQFGQAAQKWNIAHRPQIEQTAYLIAQDVGQLALRTAVASSQQNLTQGANANWKDSLTAGLRSLEGSYTSPAQITQLVGVWTPQTSAFTTMAATLAADLANHPPKSTNETVARLEGYITGLANLPPTSAPPIAPAP
jgi:hypothetical protein